MKKRLALLKLPVTVTACVLIFISSLAQGGLENALYHSTTMLYEMDVDMKTPLQKVGQDQWGRSYTCPILLQKANPRMPTYIIVVSSINRKINPIKLLTEIVLELKEYQLRFCTFGGSTTIDTPRSQVVIQLPSTHDKRAFDDFFKRLKRRVSAGTEGIEIDKNEISASNFMIIDGGITDGFFNLIKTLPDTMTQSASVMTIGSVTVVGSDTFMIRATIHGVEKTNMDVAKKVVLKAVNAIKISTDIQVKTDPDSFKGMEILLRKKGHLHRRHKKIIQQKMVAYKPPFYYFIL